MDIKKALTSHSKKAILILTVAGLLGCGSKTADEHLQEAQEHYAEHDIKAAIIELKNALKKNNAHAKARAMLGRIYLTKGQVADAEKELRRALDNGIPFEQLALPLSEALLAQGQSKEIIKEFAIAADDPEAIVSIKSLILGESHLQNREYDAAEIFLSTAQQYDDLRPRALLGQAALAFVDRDFDKSDTLTDEVLSLQPENPKAWLTKADILQTRNDLEGAEEALRNSAKFAPSKSSAYYQRAMRHIVRLQLGRNDIEAAQATLDELKSSYAGGKLPGDLMLTLLRSSLAYQQQNFEASSELANQALLIDNNNLGAKLLIGLSDSRLGKFVQAETHLQHFVAQVPQHDQARKALALVQSQTKQSEKALETLAPFSEKLDELDHQTLTLMAQTSFLAGKSEQSTMLLQKALKKAPDDPKLNFALAQTLTAQNDNDQAISVLQSLKGTTRQKQQALFTQAQIHIRSKEYSEAKEIIRNLTESLPENPAPRALQGTAHMLEGNTDLAKSSFRKAIELNPGFIPAIRALSAIEVRSGNSEDAEGVYADALKSTDTDNERLQAQLLLDYSQLLMNNNKLAKAEQHLKQAQRIEASEAQSSVLLARLYMAQDRALLAKEQLLDHQEKNFSPVQAELGKAQMILKEYNSALDSFRKLSLLEPGSPVPNYLVATAQLQLGDLDGAEESLQQSLSIYSAYMPALQAAIRLALSEDNFDKARKIVDKFEEATSDKYISQSLRGDIALAENKPAQAATIFRELYAEKAIDSIRIKLVKAITDSEGSDKAIALMEKDVVAHPNSESAHLLLANAYLNIGDNDAAIRNFEKVVALNENNPIALNNAAWLLQDIDPKRAFEYAERAYELAPDNADIKDTMNTIKEKL